MTDDAPLYNAVAMVDVALNTSMMTTTELLISYKSSRAGERQVYKFLEANLNYLTNGNLTTDAFNCLSRMSIYIVEPIFA